MTLLLFALPQFSA